MPGFELIGEEERREVLEVLDSGVLMRYGFDAARKGQWKSRELEQALTKRLNTRHTHVCSSGTAALSTALAACGIGAGDEVILPPFTFVADLETVLLAGAVPVFAEIDQTLCLDPRSVATAITSKTKAVLVVHMCGAMARIDALVHEDQPAGPHGHLPGRAGHRSLCQVDREAGGRRRDRGLRHQPFPLLPHRPGDPRPGARGRRSCRCSRRRR